MTLVSDKYGKGRVRVMRAVRGNATHQVSELDVSVMLQGAFSAAYTRADNTGVIATDSIKNLVYVVAGELPAVSPERFVSALAERCLSKYAQVSSAEVTAREARWMRAIQNGDALADGFLRDGNGVRISRAVVTREDSILSSGVADFAFLKSGGSGFTGFIRDDITTLPETVDRLCGTSMDATWVWAELPDDPARENEAILATLLDVFFNTCSESLQDSLYRMGEAVLQTRQAVRRLDFACPNKHFIPVDLGRLGSGSNAEVYVATDEPHGQIECSVARV